MSITRARKLSILAATALIGFAYGVAPVLAVGTESPPPPPPSGDNGGKSTGAPHSKKKKKSSENFLEGYRYAYGLIQKGDYAGGIAAMHALGHDEHADVANEIGYSYRKLGQYDESKAWYDKALAADPIHVRTWSYYGMWYAEQGNKLKAEDYLDMVQLICGDTDCREYKMLKDVIDNNASY